jgi:hypothetical protein
VELRQAAALLLGANAGAGAFHGGALRLGKPGPEFLAGDVFSDVDPLGDLDRDVVARIGGVTGPEYSIIRTHGESMSFFSITPSAAA